MDQHMEELLKRIEFKKQFVEGYREKCLERADIFPSYEKLIQYCDAKIEAYSSIIADLHDLFPSAITTTSKI